MALDEQVGTRGSLPLLGSATARRIGAGIRIAAPLSPPWSIWSCAPRFATAHFCAKAQRGNSQQELHQQAVPAAVGSAAIVINARGNVTQQSNGARILLAQVTQPSSNFGANPPNISSTCFLLRSFARVKSWLAKP